MSLAMSAEIINSNDTITSQPNFKKRHSNNITQKQKPGLYDINSTKVNNVLNAIHQNMYKEDDMDDDLNYYAANQTQNNASNNNNKQTPSTFKPAVSKDPSANYNNRDNVSLLKNAYMNDTEVDDYYKHVLSSYNEKHKNHQAHYTNTNTNINNQPAQIQQNIQSSNDVLIDKLNYMIHLLEEQQDQRINNVTEEIILYSFLGIFIIFIVDSFARSGKYIR